MYKTTFLSHLARAGRQHPFFSPNANSANSTVLSLVKPKVGIVTEKAYFSSWGGNGYSASNAGGSSTSQTALIAISNDDNQLWEKDLGVHRKQFRAIAGIRRYSTGTRTTSENIEGGSLRLTGAPGPDETIQKLDPEVPAESERLVDASNLPQSLDESSSSDFSDFEHHLGSLYQSASYARLCLEFSERIDLGLGLTTGSFNTFFRTLDRLNKFEHLRSDSVGDFLGVSRLLHFYSIMLENEIRPDEDTFDLLVSFLLWHRMRVGDQKTVLARCSFLEDTLQEAFIQPNRAKLESLEDIDSTSIALQIFNASISERDQGYCIELLEDLLVACASEGRVDDAVGIYDYIERKGFSKSYKIYSTLLEVFIKAKDLSGAIECFNTWKRNCHDIPPHDFWSIYNSMIRCYFEVGNEKGALKFFEAAVSQTDRVKSRSYQNLVRCYASQGQYEKAHALAEKHLGKSEYGYSRSMAEIVNAACLRGDSEMARKYFKHVTSMPAFARVPMAPWNYLAVLIADGQLDEVKQYVRTCVRHQVALRLPHLSLLITRYLDAGRVEDAFEIAAYVGDRRVIWDPTEMNKNKVGLFGELFITELLGRNLMDAKSLPAIANLVHMFSKATPATSLLKFLRAVQEGEFTEVLTTDRGVLNSLCRLVIELESDLQGVKLDANREALTAPACDAVTWMLSVLKVSDGAAGGTNFTSGTVEHLKSFAHDLGLEERGSDLNQIPISDTGSHGDQYQPLPFSGAVFKAGFHPSVDRYVSSEIARALRSADARLLNKGKFDARLPYNQVMDSFKECCSGSRDTIVHSDVFLQALSHFGRAEDFSQAQEILSLAETMLPRLIQSPECQPAATALLYDAAILAFNDLHDSATAQMYHDRVLKLGFIPSANAYASFIAKMDENKYRDSAARALDLFNEARRLGVIPTEYLFNTVIAKLAKARRNSDALAMFQEMKATGLMPNGVTYGTIINSCCRVGHTAQAEELLQEMEQRPKNQNRIAPYNTLIQHFVQTNKDREKAFFYWEKLIARAIPPTAHSYRLLIEAHGHLSPVDPVAAESVIGLMQANNVRISSIHHAAIIHMYGTVLNDLPAAKRYFDFWTSGPRPRTALDDVIFQSIIEAAVRNKDVNEMQALLDQMQAKKVPLNAYIVNLAIEGYGLENQLDQARALFDKLPTSGAGIRGKEPSTYETMIKAYNAASQSEKSLEIFDLLKTQHYPEAIVSRASALVYQGA